MRVLITSLLRLGDILMATPVIQAMKKENADVEIHVLINAQFQHLTPLLKDVDHFHLFDRTGLQKALAEPSIPILSAYDQLNEFIDKINDIRYNRIINLTHNRLSGWICSLIHGKDRVGLYFDRNGHPQFNSFWFEYLNENEKSGETEIFHFSDIYLFGAGCSLSDRQIHLHETEQGKKEADEILKGVEGPLVFLQPFTSDIKKEWKSHSWTYLAKELRAVHPTAEICVLAAPNEEERLIDLMSSAKTQGVVLRPAICSFEGALSLLHRGKLLITGDTSIKHLAMATDIQVIELSLGSSDFRRTGVYKDNAIIVRPNTSCHPCRHRDACHRDHHVCSEDVEGEAISLIASQVLLGREDQLPVIAREFINELEIFRTQLSDAGYWIAHPILSRRRENSIEQWLERSTLKLLLEQEHRKPLGEYGSEGFRIKESLAKIYPHEHWGELAKHLTTLESESYHRDQRISQLMNQLRMAVQSNGDWKSFQNELASLLSVREKSHLGSLNLIPMWNFSESEMVSNISEIRHVQSYLQSAHDKSQIKLKLIRSLKTHLLEIL